MDELSIFILFFNLFGDDKVAVKIRVVNGR